MVRYSKCTTIQKQMNRFGIFTAAFGFQRFIRCTPTLALPSSGAARNYKKRGI